MEKDLIKRMNDLILADSEAKHVKVSREIPITDANEDKCKHNCHNCNENGGCQCPPPKDEKTKREGKIGLFDNDILPYDSNDKVCGFSFYEDENARYLTIEYKFENGEHEKYISEIVAKDCIPYVYWYNCSDFKNCFDGSLLLTNPKIEYTHTRFKGKYVKLEVCFEKHLKDTDKEEIGDYYGG